MKRWGLLAAGWSAVALGAVGIFLPLLPTTPLLLLAAVCFARSSERVHRWLLCHRYFGGFLRDYLAGCGIPLRAKVSAVALIWLTISGSAFFLVTSTPVRALLFATALGTTAYLLRQPTCHTRPADPAGN
jgi:uncharacterized membrane protein YbaN (DUF454 family)